MLSVGNFLFAELGRFVAFLEGVGFADVFALLGLAVIARTFLVINVGLGIHPNETVCSAFCRGGSRCGRGARSSWSGRTVRLEEGSETMR